MSFSGISIREAMEKLNAPNNGWFLPQVQRQYVWGARHESEDYVCLLLDSLLKRYPIGGIVLWETTTAVPYREFVRDYAPGQFALQVDEGRWGAAKSLVYDGQQRLQTLYSVLYYRFNGRILHFDLLFDADKEEADETGFLFRDADAPTEPRYLRLTELMSKSALAKERVLLEQRALKAAEGNSEQEMTIRVNLASLWDVFVDTNIKSIAHFSVKAESPREVNEIFRRLNTGGIALNQLELVLSKIKAVKSDYEEELWALSERITKCSGGIEFPSASILQFFHLLVKNTIRIDEGRMDPKDVAAFRQALAADADPLVEVFENYLWGLLKINHASIIPRPLAIYPIAAYLCALKRSGHEWRIRKMSDQELRIIHRYFLTSQFCDWNTQTMINAFSRLAMNHGEAGRLFPFTEIRKVAIEKSRTGSVHVCQFLNQPWLATKVLMPHRIYLFHERKPQVDHIFPLKLAGRNDAYQRDVDVVWNFQPMPAEINNFKRARHPKEFFNSSDGSKYFDAYDYLPKRDSALWDDHLAFLEEREAQMRAELRNRYDVELEANL